VETDLTEIGCDGLDWINLAYVKSVWLALVNMGMNLWLP
jgi:hypothetical protein